MPGGSPHPQRRPHRTVDPSSGQAGPPHPLPEVAGGCPGLLRYSRLPLAGPPGACGDPPHRDSASRASPGDGLFSRSRPFLDPARRPRRRCAHGCGRRVALQVAFRAPPPEQPRAHWLAALIPALIGSLDACAHWPETSGGGYCLAPPLQAPASESLSRFRTQGRSRIRFALRFRDRVGRGERLRTRLQPRSILRLQKLKI